MLIGSKEVVTPLENGVQRICSDLKTLDSGFRRNDGKKAFGTYYELISVVQCSMISVQCQMLNANGGSLLFRA